MSNYPFSFDNNITLPGVSGSTQEDVAITALRSAVFAIEVELGVTPSGVYPDVRTRLDILEARILFATSAIEPDILNDGYVKSPLFIYNIPQSIILSISDGYGAPTENRLDGSLYMRGGDGYANNQLYVRLNGQWSPVQTEQFTASNDLTGYPPGSDGHLAQTVIGLYNHPFNTTMDVVGAIQDGYHVTWNNFTGEWEDQTGFIPGHDLMAFSGPYGRTGQTVIGLQGFPLSGFPPTDGYTLVWQASDNRWEPQARAVIFDGYVARINLMSNRAQQSPILNTKTGIVNFGTDTSGLTTGASENYATILGGDRNVAAGIHAAVMSGFANQAQDGYSLILNGNGNTAVLQNSTVVNGVGNTASGLQAVVVDGYTNVASGSRSFVLNGGNNTAGGLFSGILNGISNTIIAGAAQSGIGWGQFNTINAGGISSVILGGSGNQASATNILIGTSTGANVASNYSTVLTGIGHTINSTSDHSVIVSGNTHTISAASGFSFIGAGNNLTASGLYATILNSTGGSVSGLHTLILNGNSNSVTAGYSTIINGLSNTISGGLATSYATIVDGYSNNISGAGSFIGDGYSHSISGQYSSVLNGNFNIIAGRNSTILNGGTNNIDVNSGDVTILGGVFNSVAGTLNAVVSGSSNIVTTSSNTYVLGNLNNIQSTSSKVIGSNNTIGAGGTLNRIFGNSNTLGLTSVMNNVFGQANRLGPAASTHDNTVIGANNIVDGYGNSTIHGSSNVVLANFGNVRGQFGTSRMFGEEVRANSRFTQTTIAVASNGATLPQGTINVASTSGFPANGTFAIVTSAGLQIVTYTGGGGGGTTFTGCSGGTGVMSTGGQVGKIGEAQWSSLILTGSSTAGAAISLQLQDSVATNPTFVDGYAYDMSIKLLITNTGPIVTGVLNPSGVVPSRHTIDVLAHQESGVLYIDNINFTVSTPNTSDSVSRTPWTVTVTSIGNQLILQVDVEAITSYVQPGNTPSNRRAIATIDMREISRI